MTEFTIGQVAEQSGLSRQAIRYYEREGLTAPPHRTDSNYRLYSRDAVDRLAFIAHAREWGFSLDEIRDLLTLQDANGDRAEARRIAAEKLQKIRRQIDVLTRMEAALSRTYDLCPGEGPMDQGCPIINAISEDDTH